MIVLRWDTPPEYRPRGRRPGRWRKAFDALKADPGRWGLVAEGLTYREVENGRKALCEYGCRVRTQKVDCVGHELWAMFP